MVVQGCLTEADIAHIYQDEKKNDIQSVDDITMERNNRSREYVVVSVSR